MTPSPHDPPPGARPPEGRVHAFALRTLGLEPADRLEVVDRMFARSRRDTVSYWLLLLLSMAIATVGLVLGSAAVVIGAMLIAPLMGPIVALGMGLVLGSPVLTLRSFGRMTGGVLATIAGAALLTHLLPFQEVTPEVASRTSPTALDLLLAVFVAVGAAFTTARPGSETTSAAAGTAIGIALVPPVCVIGFGLGTADLAVAGGATLLFLTNLTAILVVSVGFFWLLGFETVDLGRWEAAALAEARPRGWTRRAVGLLTAVFGSRWGRVVRVGIPVVLVAAVFVPLRQALEQVAWEVRTRNAVARVMGDAVRERQAVQTEVQVTPGAVAAQLYLVGSVDDAAALERGLAARIAAATGVVPSVRVVAVPDAGALRQATAADAAPERTPPDLAEVRRRVGAALAAAWPAAELGPVVAWRLEVPDSAAPRVVVEHLGAPAGAAAEALLGRGLSDRAALPLSLGTRAFPPAPRVAAAGEAEAWLPALAEVLAGVRSGARIHACVEVPADPVLARAPALGRAADRVRREAAAVPDGRASVRAGDSVWSVRYAPRGCVPADSAEAAPPPA